MNLKPGSRIVFHFGSLRFVKVARRGNLDKERVIFRVKVAEDLIKFVVVGMRKSRTGEKTATDLNRDFYWFPSREVKKDDFVVLWTKEGENRTYLNKSGDTVHAFYWGKPAPVWTGETDMVGLLRISGWNLFSVEQEEEEE